MSFQYHTLFVASVWAGVATVIVFLALLFRDRSRYRFISKEMHQKLAFSISDSALVARAIFAGATIFFALFALARPGVAGDGTEVQEVATADIAVVLDVSRSMLATDATPNRLQRAKQGIFNILRQVSESSLALIAFAGEASMQCALTSNKEYFRMSLRNAGPHLASRGGTNIYGAIKAGVEALRQSAETKILILITDGEDHESNPMAAAELAKEEKVIVVTVGFGSEDGSQIVIEDPQTKIKQAIVDSEGNPVVSRLDSDLLRKIAETTKGAYIPAGTSAVQMDQIVEDFIRPLLASKTVERSKNRIDMSSVFVWLSLFSFLLASVSPLLARRYL